MSAVSSPSRQMSWQPGRQRVSVLAALAIRKETVSRRLLKLREDHPQPDGDPLPQERAAQRVGVSVRQWQRWEGGDSIPYPRNLGAIADTFDFDVNEFYSDEPVVTNGTQPPLTQLDRIEAAVERNHRLLLWLGSKVSETPVEEFERAFTEREADESRARDTKPPAHGEV